MTMPNKIGVHTLEKKTSSVEKDYQKMTKMNQQTAKNMTESETKRFWLKTRRFQ